MKKFIGILSLNFLSIIIVFSIEIYSQQNIYFVENQGAKVIKSVNDGSASETIINSSIGLYGIAIDTENDALYYTNVVTDQIFKSDLNGNNIEILLDADDSIDAPRGIAVDAINNKIFWVEAGTGKLKSAGLNGENPNDIIDTLNSPVDIALDLINNKIYVSENGTGAKRIIRCNFDGTDIEIIIQNIDQAGAITVDAAIQKLYWIDFGSEDRIMSANTDGFSIDTVKQFQSVSLRGISSDKAGYLYYTDVLNNRIGRINKENLSETIIISGLSSPLGIDTNWDIAVPVELVSFTSEPENFSVLLKWETKTETNNYGFEIERGVKGDDNSWGKIGFVKGSGTSTSAKYYSFKDSNPSGGKIFLYRLKQIDFDGSFKYSEVVEAKILPSEFKLFQNYPNPFNPATIIKFYIPQKSFVRLKVYELLGREVASLINSELDEGIYEIKFNAEGLSNGVYIYKFEANNFTAVNKMLLIK